MGLCIFEINKVYSTNTIKFALNLEEERQYPSKDILITHVRGLNDRN